LDPILSREELDALLGSGPNPASSTGNSRLLTALQVTVKSLQTMVDAVGLWTASDFSPTTWGELAHLYNLSSNTVFLLVEARVPGGSLYVLTSTITACHLDEVAAVALETVTDESAFIGWRRVIEYMLSDLCLTLLPNECDLTFSPRTLPPRRWSPNSHTFSTMPTHELLITARLWPQDDLDHAVYLLLPATTLREISGSELATGSEAGGGTRETIITDTDDSMRETVAETEVGPGKQNEQSSVLSQVDEAMESNYASLADIPLYITVLCDTDAVPIGTVATWRPGMQVPVEFNPGDNARLFANGVCIANGRLVSDPNGRLLVEISSLQSGVS
jgi:flagellar motor switch/type III secretory pathway protein FliN